MSSPPPSGGTASRVERALPAGVSPRLRGWIVLLSAAVDANLQAHHATPHRDVAVVLARAVGMSPAQEEAVGVTLDLLQLAVELADDVADWSADEAAGRPHVAVLAAIPPASRPALPGVLTLAAGRVLSTTFRSPEWSLPRALDELTLVLARMTEGQGEEDVDTHIALTSDEQARLLGLPLWLSPSIGSERAAQFDRWARRFGRTWELAARVEEGRCRPSDLHLARAACREVWPDWGPFVAPGPLSVERLLPVGMS